MEPYCFFENLKNKKSCRMLLASHFYLFFNKTLGILGLLNTEFYISSENDASVTGFNLIYRYGYLNKTN